MRPAGEKTARTATSGVRVPQRCATTTIIIRVGTRWSRRGFAQTSRGSWALTSTPPTMCIPACINAVGCICYAIATNSKSSIPSRLRSNSGPRTSKPSMTGPSPTPGLIRACLRPSKRPPGANSNAPSSRSCGSSVRPTRTRLRPCRRCVTGSNVSYPNCSSLSRDPRCRRTTIWPSAVCTRWSLRAKSVAARAALPAPRPAWPSSVASARGRLRGSTLSCTVWLCFPSKPLRLRVNNFPIVPYLDGGYELPYNGNPTI